MLTLKKRTTLFAAALFALISFQSCTTYKSYWVAPEFTNVSKISQLRAGMSTDEINKTLGTQPYDIYHIQQDGSSVIVYNYRIKERRMTVPTDPVQRERTIRNDEKSQTEGEPWYQEDHNRVFVLMKDNKMKSLITDNGYENSQYLLLQHNTIQLISKNDLTNVNNNKNESTTSSTTTTTTTNAGGSNVDQVIVPLKKNEKETRPNALQQATKSKSGAGKVLGALASIGLVVLLVGVLASEL